MANLRDWYYRQIVSQSDLDEAFGWTQDADQAIGSDRAMWGIADAYGVTEDSPPSLNVVVGGPGIAYDKEGQRVYMPDLSASVDCSLDEYGSSTAVTTPWNERWVSVFVRFARRLSDPAVDGNAVTVYTKNWEDYELFVRRASEQAIGTNDKPPILSDALLLCDIQLVNAQTTIVNAGINVSRREDWYRASLTNLGAVSHGTAKAAVTALFSEVDALQTSAGIAFTASGTWADGSALGSTNVQDAINEIVADLADNTTPDGAGRVGADAHTTTGGYADLVQGTLRSQLNSLADDIDGHIAGGAPQHPASGITTASIAGSPESHTGSDAQTALSEIFGHLNARTERSESELIDGYWQRKTVDGGTLPPGITLIEEISQKRYGTAPINGNNAWAHMDWHANTINLGQDARTVDLCAGWNYTSGDEHPVVWVLDGYDGHAASAVYVFEIDARTWSTGSTRRQLNVTAGDYPVACCCDGPYLYVLCRVSTGTDSRVYRFPTNPWSSTPDWSRYMAGQSVFSAYFTRQNSNIIVADDDNLAISFGAEITSTGNIVAILAKDNSAIAYGNGNLGTNGHGPTGGLASDGTEIYFGARLPTTSGDASIGMANISDPTTSHARHPSPVVLSRQVAVCDLIFDGKYVWYITNRGYVGVVFSYGSESVGVVGITDVAYDAANELTPPSSVLTLNRRAHLAFDGIHVWAAATLDGNSSDTRRFFSPIDAMAASPDYLNTQQPKKLHNWGGTFNHHHIDEGYTVWGPMLCYNGRLWTLPTIGETGSGNEMNEVGMMARPELRGF